MFIPLLIGIALGGKLLELYAIEARRRKVEKAKAWIQDQLDRLEIHNPDLTPADLDRIYAEVDDPDIDDPKIVWCDGYPVRIGDHTAFEGVRSKALLKGMYNSKNLDEGGRFDLKVAELRVQGYPAEEAIYEARKEDPRQ